MTQEWKIAGICLVRNDDRFLDQVIRNALAICDELILADHGSSDGTADICLRWKAHDPRVSYYRIGHPSESHELIRPYAGTCTWVFGVDGDELYEPDRLRLLKSQLQSGRFADSWQVMGKVLHCVSYDEKKQIASGYLARPARPMTKLYNFSLIDDWEGPCSERMHHGRVVFRDGRIEGAKDCAESELEWDDAVFRCLHMVFVQRSSIQKKGQVARPNIAEKNAWGMVSRLRYHLACVLGREPDSRTKQDAYIRGPLCTISTKPFFQT